MRDKRTEIRQALQALTVEPKKMAASAPPAPSGPVDLLLVTSFTRTVSLALALGKGLAGNPAAGHAVRQATRGGMDLQELKALLDSLLK